jgi:phosphoribosylformylglycinamidine synthase
MIVFFKGRQNNLFVIEALQAFTETDITKLCWLFGEATIVDQQQVDGTFTGPRREMVTPWSTNAVEITQNMGISGIVRIEEFIQSDQSQPVFDPMLQAVYHNPGQQVFTLTRKAEALREIEDIAAYNLSEGLALSPEEVDYLQELSAKIGRKLTDSEVFGFSQVNSEHCRHKIFNGTFMIDGHEKKDSLFALIKRTSAENPNLLVSAYKDNVAFIVGPAIEQFAPETQHQPDYFTLTPIDSVISLKAETHNFPTTVEPFNGASTGTGGEIRDRLAGGKGSLPIAGTAVYMTSYPRSEPDRTWEEATTPRKWLYQTPEEILIKASNGASDFGNKFGQPLICGSVLTFEHTEAGKTWGYDKVVMLAGGIGYGKMSDSQKEIPEPGDVIVVLGGDNYRIGMGGGAVSSVATGEYGNSIELNAVQRANPEMQKRVSNAIRAMVESGSNPVVSIHDHGAGGHLNCLSELVEATGGVIHVDKLPVGDPTLSMKEIIGNESQERMGLVIREKDVDLLRQVAERERAPMYIAGEITGDNRLLFESTAHHQQPIDLQLGDFFGKPPRTVMTDLTLKPVFEEISWHTLNIYDSLRTVLQLEAVACKDWLTNKVDRSVTGRVAMQQCAGPLQLPLNNTGVVALDYTGKSGIATSIGHAPVSGLADPKAGSVLSVAEALTNLVWAPLEHGLKGVSLSANWMWPCRNAGEDARLYEAVEAMSDFAVALGINIPTGKDSLSMTQKYPGGNVVYSPGTVIVSAVGCVSDVRHMVTTALSGRTDTLLMYVDFSDCPFALGGSSFAQTINRIGNETPAVNDPAYFVAAFDTMQKAIQQGLILSGHDVSAGGLITTLLEMTFSHNNLALDINMTELPEEQIFRLLFSEKPAVVIETAEPEKLQNMFDEAGVKSYGIGAPVAGTALSILNNHTKYSFDIPSLRTDWFRSSYLLDRKQCGEKLAFERFENYTRHELNYRFPHGFTGQGKDLGLRSAGNSKTGIRAAIIREKGVNGDREMAYMLYLAGFDVKDVHMTDLMTGRETLDDINLIVFVGGFSNSDVLGSAKGWAGAFKYNALANETLARFYQRSDTLSLGVCNGCQLMIELNLIYPEHEVRPVMLHNASHKFESGFLTVDIPENESVMLHSLAGSRLGVFVAHGEGKFSLPLSENSYHVAAKYSYSTYPANPNGSDYDVAALVSANGRHLGIMPHLERSFVPWQWPWYTNERSSDEVTPWMLAFVNAREWIRARK